MRKNLLLCAFLLGLSGVLVLTATACPQDDDDDAAAIITQESVVPTTAPLSSMVAVTFQPDSPIDAADLVDYVKELTERWNSSPSSLTAAGITEFPLAQGKTDEVRVLKGLKSNVVVSWLDPLTDNLEGPRMGAHADYIAYFGEGWDNDWIPAGQMPAGTRAVGDYGAVVGSAPQFNGSGTAGWVWVNHEYISAGSGNTHPDLTVAAAGQPLTFARFLRNFGALSNNVEASTWAQADLDNYIRNYKRELGGSWFRVVQDPYTLEWHVDRSATNRRYDGTSNTLLRVEGQALGADDHDDFGADLPSGVVSGLQGNCSGGQSPWGTVFSCEENTQDYYGDFEACWSSSNLFNGGSGFASGDDIDPTTYSPSTTAEWGRISDANGRHSREFYGYVAEMDPGKPSDLWYESNDGVGHRKMGPFGRARWENVATHVGGNWRLVDGQPVVLYACDDRRSGRIFKWVSANNYFDGMTRVEVRNLLDTGTLFVAHFTDLDHDTGNTVGGSAPTAANPGDGVWIELSTTNVSQVAPNATALGAAGTWVGDALQDTDYNGIGGFADDDMVRRALFTACAKIGVRELNRPEDIEWNPVDQLLYVAFTNFSGNTCCDADGVLATSAPGAGTGVEQVARNDRVGWICAMEEANQANPAASTTFTFHQVWKGSESATPDVYTASDPDNIFIDREGGVWFGTDGNYQGTSNKSDALYYLDQDDTHNVTFGKAIRVAAAPSDAEFTGPCLSADQRTLFFSAQHPGENATANPSQWPQPRLYWPKIIRERGQ
ncbi:MAG: DUF839 domain-containing protein [Planctomycetes bacterium]|nr:DUF839 domain-containing protein [Planctomycetota bacterium]